MRRPLTASLLLALALAVLLACRAASMLAPEPTSQPVAAATPAAAMALTPALGATTGGPTNEPATRAPATLASPAGGASPLTKWPPLPEPALFPVSWEERADFAPGLVTAAQAAASALPQASVYHLALELDASLTQLAGQQELLYTNEAGAPLEELYFRLYPNLMGGAITVDSVMVNGVAVTPETELARSALRLPLPVPLQPGEQVVISMGFEVSIPQEGGGHYGTFILDEEILALAHFYPILAVYDDEGWNLEIPPESGDLVYSESSFYRVQVTAPADLVLAATGIESAREVMGERQHVTYVAGPVRDFYLAGSPRFAQVSRTAGEITLNSYAFPEYGEAAQRVLDHAADAVAIFEQHFGPYPFVELDLASTPTLALGVEYPGIVVNALRLYDSASTLYPPIQLESTTAHEVAHQWFYSTVGNDQLDEPWLDEALAQYGTLLYFSEVYGEEGRQGFLDSLYGRWQRSGSGDTPVGLPVAAYGGAEYGAIVYGRGPLFFEALREEIGDEAFAAFLREYYERHTWGIATTESLRAVAEETCGCDLGDLFVEWIYAED
jgi:hypothetical protein